MDDPIVPNFREIKYFLKRFFLLYLDNKKVSHSEQEKLGGGCGWGVFQCIIAGFITVLLSLPSHGKALWSYSVLH